MKNKINLTVSLFFSFTLCFAQAPVIQWQRCYGGSWAEHAYAVKKTFDGGLIIAGGAASIDGDLWGMINWVGPDFWLIKTDSLSNIEWQSRFGGNGSEEAYSVFQTSDSGYIVAGFTNSNDHHILGYVDVFPENDVWIIKCDRFGVEQWNMCYGGTKDDKVRSIIQTQDGGYVFAGLTYSNDSSVSGNHGGNTADAWVAKLDDVGNLLWQKCLGGTDLDNAYSIIECNDGNLCFLGYTYSHDGDVSFNHDSSTTDYWLVKLDDDTGNLLWEKTFGGSEHDFGYSLKQTPDQGFILAGATGSTNGDVTGAHGYLDYWLVKTDSVGNLMWQKCYGGSSQDWGRSVTLTQDHGFAFAGFTDSNDGDVSGLHTTLDYSLMKIDSIGNLEWQKCLGGSSMDEILTANNVVETNPGEYVLAGITTSTDGDVTGLHGTTFDAWVVKLAPLAAAIPSIETRIENLIAAATQNGVDVSFNSSTSMDAIITLYDISGRNVLSMPTVVKTGNNQISIKTEELNDGIYFLKLTFDEGEVSKKLVLLEHKR